MQTQLNVVQKRSFPSTHWSSVNAAADSQTLPGKQALGDLLTRYRPALIGYLMRKFFHSLEDASDLLQEFILENVLRKELFAGIERARGHQFRRFLLCALHAFAVSHHRSRTALKRRPSNGFASLEELAETGSAPGRFYHSNAFDLEWARGVVAQALQAMEEECKETGRFDVWGVFNNRVVKPLLEGAEMQDYSNLVQEFGFKSPAQAHNVLVTGKRAFARSLRRVVGEYAPTPEATEQEIRELENILSQEQ